MWFILAGVRSVAGASAVHGYHVALAQRRRAAARAAGVLVLAMAAGWAAAASNGSARETYVALSAGGVGVAWLIRPRPDPERWLRGAHGEAATALLLDQLGRRWAVLHDLRIPGSRANVDHLVIGPTGVWMLDTKTTRARVRAGWGRVHFGGHRLDPGPTRWEAQVVADRLGARVRPLIVVHGDGLRRRGARCGRVRVVPAASVLRPLRRGRRRLDRDEIRALAGRAEREFHPAGPSPNTKVTAHG